MYESKKNRVIFNIYRCNGSSFVNVFDVVDFIVEFYKINKKHLCKQKLYAVMYLYQLFSTISNNVSKIDDVFIIKNRGELQEELQVKEVTQKLSRFSDEDNLTQKIKPAHSNIYLLSRWQHTKVESRLNAILGLSLEMSHSQLIDRIRQSTCYKMADKEGVISFPTIKANKENKEKGIVFNLKTPPKTVLNALLHLDLL